MTTPHCEAHWLMFCLLLWRIKNISPFQPPVIIITGAFHLFIIFSAIWIEHFQIAVCSVFTTHVWWLREEWCFWIFTGERVSDLQHWVERHLYLCNLIWLIWRNFLKCCFPYIFISTDKNKIRIKNILKCLFRIIIFLLCYCVEFWGLSTSLLIENVFFKRV